MPRIFGREVPEHPLGAKLAPLEGEQGTTRFIAENWRYDWRVSAEREEVLLQHACALTAPAELEACYREYHRTCICHGSPCEYCGQANHGNRIAGSPQRHQALCRVVCLNTFRLAARESLHEVRGLPQNAWALWLEDRIARERETRGALGLQALLARLFSAWNQWPQLDDRPAWAAPWVDVEPLLAEPDWPDRVHDALGLGDYDAGAWLVVLRYSMKEAGVCYRPTSLDAGWVPWHVLSPPGQPYGYALDLSPAGGNCCPEVVHRPRALDIKQWTGHIGRTTPPAQEYNIGSLRQRHYALLASRFPQGGSSWQPPTPVQA